LARNEKKDVDPLPSILLFQTGKKRLERHPKWSFVSLWMF